MLMLVNSAMIKCATLSNIGHNPTSVEIIYNVVVALMQEEGSFSWAYTNIVGDDENLCAQYCVISCLHKRCDVSFLIINIMSTNRLY